MTTKDANNNTAQQQLLPQRSSPPRSPGTMEELHDLFGAGVPLRRRRAAAASGSAAAAAVVPLLRLDDGRVEHGKPGSPAVPA